MTIIRSIQLILLFASFPNNLVDATIPTDANGTRNALANNLPHGMILPDLDGINVQEGINKITEFIRKKCLDASGNENAFEEASNAAATFSECFQNLYDFSNIGEEIEQAKPTGDLDIVFNKYCGKRHDGLKCLEVLSDSTNNCLSEEEINHKKTFINMIKKLLEFVCHQNGNQIALFIAEEGPECFSSKQEQLGNCFNQTFSKYISNDIFSTENLPSLAISQENCVDFKKFENCVVGELEKCRESTPANLIEALFRYVKKETPCKK